MLSIRPVQHTDSDALAELLAGTPQPIDPAAIQTLIDDSVRALAGDGPIPQRLVLVLEDRLPSAATTRPAAAPLLGAVSLAGTVGLDLPRASYRVGTVVHASAELKMFHRAHTLLLCNDLTGHAELGVPVMAPTDSAQSLMRLLIDAALLFVADHPDRFALTVFAELPGIGGPHGASPFWRGLGRHFHAGALPLDSSFFQSPARSHMARLMPKHPLYSALLGPDAEACIGQHAASAQALADALQAQGLRHRGQVNLFDAGPVLEAAVADLGAVRDSLRCRVMIDDQAVGELAPVAEPIGTLLAASGADENASPWEARLISKSVHDGQLRLGRHEAANLGLVDGQRLRVLPQRRASGARSR